MGFNRQSLINGTEHRKQYTGSKEIDSSCRNHGDCPWCYGNRTYKVKKREIGANRKLQEFKEDID